MKRNFDPRSLYKSFCCPTFLIHVFVIQFCLAPKVGFAKWKALRELKRNTGNTKHTQPSCLVGHIMYLLQKSLNAFILVAAVKEQQTEKLSVVYKHVRLERDDKFTSKKTRLKLQKWAGRRDKQERIEEEIPK